MLEDPIHQIQEKKGQVQEDDGPEEDEDQERNTNFCDRIKHDWQIIKENMKLSVVWRFYLFWALCGIIPNFQAMDYYQIMDTYKISQI